MLLRAIHPMNRTLGCSRWQCWRTCRLIRSLDSGNEALSGCVGLVLKVGKTVLDGAPEFRTAGLMRPFFKKIFRSHRRVRDRAVFARSEQFNVNRFTPSHGSLPKRCPASAGAKGRAGDSLASNVRAGLTPILDR
ncbi:hypothetical protein OHAE_4091 [Ochrobactrum soli]|uniref:Uncharacterized protein n=1 Tax=Ochrobactrum soli TaxID=2448455 RepID=A0A2P9HB32_9HYPH|nr:hypothetical protein OHAE_4091 [[Ochrobactrum] soli]